MQAEMSYPQVMELCSLVSRPFSAGMFRLLLSYRDVSASEAASRLDLHIRTAQDFLEGLLQAGLVSRKEVMEGKRPYFRYAMKEKKLIIDFSLEKLVEQNVVSAWEGCRIREKADNGAMFTTGHRENQISTVSLFTGEGRNKRERKLNLTQVQGKFLFHLPFPNMHPVSVEQIMEDAGLPLTDLGEVADLLNLLGRYGVIEKSERHL